MSTCNRLDLQILGSQPVMPKNLSNTGWDRVHIMNYGGYNELESIVLDRFYCIKGL